MYRVKLVYMLLRGSLPGGMKAWEAQEGDSSARLQDCCVIGSRSSSPGVSPDEVLASRRTARVLARPSLFLTPVAARLIRRTG